MLLIRDTSSAPRTVVNPTDFTLQTVGKTITLQGATPATQTTFKDAVLNNFISATTQTALDFRANFPLHGNARGLATFASSATNIATIDSLGIVTPHAAGTTNITIDVPGLTTKEVTLTVVQAGGQMTTTLNAFVTGSLGRHLADSVAALIAGKTPPDLTGSLPPAWSALLNLFMPDGVTRNTGIWTGSIDTTGIPRFSVGSINNGVLITPRDMIFASHYGASNPTFIASDGSTVTRTIATTRTLTSPVGDGGDILVATLNADVPSTVTPFKVLPSDWKNYLPQPQYGYPCVATNQDRTLLLHDLILNNLGFQKSLNTGRASWWYTPRGGDSGSPVFMIIDGELVLLTTWHSVEQGPALADNLTPVNAAITANGSPYAVTVKPLDSFTRY